MEPATLHTHELYEIRGPTALIRGHWTAILAGMIAGFGVAVLMSTLGAALGISAGAALVDEPDAAAAARDVAPALGIGRGRPVRSRRRRGEAGLGAPAELIGARRTSAGAS